jgi:hypothetical protein
MDRVAGAAHAGGARPRPPLLLCSALNIPCSHLALVSQ